MGNWKDGKLNGRGTLILPNGEKYVWDCKDNRRHGQGTETYPNGSKYVGEFKNGKRWKKLLSGMSSLSE